MKKTLWRCADKAAQACRLSPKRLTTKLKRLGKSKSGRLAKIYITVIHIHTSSLREVPEDIPVLANHFVAKYRRWMNTEMKQFTKQALEGLSTYSSPGNARQLENKVNRLVASVRGSSFTEDYLDTSITNSKRETQPAPEPESSRSLPDAVERLDH